MESKSKKRKHEELDVHEVESLDEPLSTVTVHGVVSSLSPIKKGSKSNYFDGSVSDGKSKVRLVGFRPSQRMQINKLMQDKHPIKIDDCEVRQAHRGRCMEIVMKGSTKSDVSSKKFDLSDIVIDDEITPLNKIESKGIYDRVSVRVRVTKVSDVAEVATGKKKQDVCSILSDSLMLAMCILFCCFLCRVCSIVSDCLVLALCILSRSLFRTVCSIVSDSLMLAMRILCLA